MAQTPTPWWAQTRSSQPMPSQPTQDRFYNPGVGMRYPMGPMQNHGLNGRYVDNENDIKVGDVPTDGSVAYFPTNDYSCIIAKAWANDGQIRAMRYVAEVPKEPEKPVLVPQQQSTPQIQTQGPVQEPQSMTAEQVSQMIDIKLNQLVAALTSQPSNMQGNSNQQQPPKKTKKEEAPQ